MFENQKPINMAYNKTSDVRAGDIKWYDFCIKDQNNYETVIQGYRPVLVLTSIWNKATVVPLTTQEKYDVCGISMMRITSDGKISVPAWYAVTTVLSEKLESGPKTAAVTCNLKDTYPDMWKQLINFYHKLLTGEICYETLVLNKRNEIRFNVLTALKRPVVETPEPVVKPKAPRKPYKSVPAILAEFGEEEVKAKLSSYDYTYATLCELFGCSANTINRMKHQMNIMLRRNVSADALIGKYGEVIKNQIQSMDKETFKTIYHCTDKVIEELQNKLLTEHTKVRNIK